MLLLVVFCCLIVVVALFISLIMVMHGSRTQDKGEKKAVDHSAIIASCVGKTPGQCDALMKDLPYTYTFIDRTVNTLPFKSNRPPSSEADIRFFLHHGVVEFYMR